MNYAKCFPTTLSNTKSTPFWSNFSLLLAPRFWTSGTLWPRCNIKSLYLKILAGGQGVFVVSTVAWVQIHCLSSLADQIPMKYWSYPNIILLSADNELSNFPLMFLMLSSHSWLAVAIISFMCVLLTVHLQWSQCIRTFVLCPKITQAHSLNAYTNISSPKRLAPTIWILRVCDEFILLHRSSSSGQQPRWFGGDRSGGGLERETVREATNGFEQRSLFCSRFRYLIWLTATWVKPDTRCSSESGCSTELMFVHSLWVGENYVDRRH